VDVAEVRLAAAALAEGTADLVAQRAGLSTVDGGRAGGADRLGGPFAAAYAGARDAALALVGALAACAGAAGRDLATLAATTEQADAEAAAAFGRSR
jgi:hypothetical protein